MSCPLLFSTVLQHTVLCCTEGRKAMVMARVCCGRSLAHVGLDGSFLKRISRDTSADASGRLL